MYNIHLMRDPELQSRLDRQIVRQEDRRLGRELRHEAFYRLFEDHQDMDPETFESWLELLEDEEREPASNLSAGATALIMMDVRDISRKRPLDV